MLVTSKNGVRVNIFPKNKFNPIDWWEVLWAIILFKTNDIEINPKDWVGVYRSCSIRKD